MKKSAFLLVIVLALSLILAACSAGDAPSPT